MAAENLENSKAHDDLLATAKKRFQLAEEFEKDIREEALIDWKFRKGEQWPDDIKQQRILEGRPTLVINRVVQHLRQVTNDQRQNRPAIKVHPVDDKADIETAKILQGMLRHIEQDSGADVAYDTAFEGAATGGFGYLRVLTQYVSPESFDQEIKIQQIEDPFSVYFDPNSKEPDGSDAKWAFITEDIPKEDFIAKYGESKLSTDNAWESYANRSDWVRKDTVRVAEYFYTEYKNITLVETHDGEVFDLEEKRKELQVEEIPKQLIKQKKKAKRPVIKWCLINGCEVLEETEWPGRWIPIVPVYGDKFIVDGKRILEGVVRHARDPQRMYNYWKSTEAETITLAPKAPFIVAEGQITPDYEGMWASANQKTFPYLIYKPTTHEGMLVPPPQRNFGEPPIQAISMAGSFAAEDIKSTTGIYDAALGNRSNETSGKAIDSRKAQAQTSNFHLVDNLFRSIRQVGRIGVDLIPKIYDTARASRILGEEGDAEVILINEFFKRHGQEVRYDLSAGKYDVTLDTGPNFQTKRQEASQSMLELSKAAPNLMSVAPDLIVKNLDIPGSQEIAERLKKTLPPGMVENKDQAPIPPEVQAQMQQMGQMLDQLTQTVNEQAETISQKRMELESKERIEFAKIEAQLQIEAAKLKSKEVFTPGGLEQLLSEIAQINTRLEILGINEPVDPNEMGHTQPQNQQFLNGNPELDRFDEPIQPQPTDGFSSGSNMEGQEPWQ